jgi:hypothetical protein
MFTFFYCFINYSPFNKSVRVTVFGITREQKEIEICGFRPWIATMIAHLFRTRRNFQWVFPNTLFWKSSENQLISPKLYIRAYWFFYIFGISIENWVNSYMLRIVSEIFFFVENLSPRTTSKNEVSQNAVSIV